MENGTYITEATLRAMLNIAQQARTDLIEIAPVSKAERISTWDVRIANGEYDTLRPTHRVRGGVVVGMAGD